MHPAIVEKRLLLHKKDLLTFEHHSRDCSVHLSEAYHLLANGDTVFAEKVVAIIIKCQWIYPVQMLDWRNIFASKADRVQKYYAHI